MIRVKVTTVPYRPLMRQLPPLDGFEFRINDEDPDCDWFVAFDGPWTGSVRVRCPREHRILVTVEPPPLRVYHKPFVRQFGIIYTCHKRLCRLPHTEVHLSQQAIDWELAGYCKFDLPEGWKETGAKPFTYAELKSLKPDKTRLLSVISSNKRLTKGHRLRLAFVETLKAHFGDQIDVFGRGIRDFHDKWDAIVPYQFHIALENSTFPHYWTEKLADSYLGWAFPIYYGCPNIGEYFAADQLAVIDIADPSRAIRTIEQIIAGGYDRRTEAIRQAREMVLDRYNFFALVANHIRKAPATSSPPEDVQILHNEMCKGSVYRLVHGIWRRLPRRLKRMVK